MGRSLRMDLQPAMAGAQKRHGVGHETQELSHVLTRRRRQSFASILAAEGARVQPVQSDSDTKLRMRMQHDSRAHAGKCASGARPKTARRSSAGPGSVRCSRRGMSITEHAAEDEWGRQFHAWDARCEAADAAEAIAAETTAAIQALDLRLPDSRSSSAKRAADESGGDCCGQIQPDSKRVHRAAHRRQGSAAVPCKLEQHEVRMGELHVTLQRRVPGIAATKKPKSHTAHKGPAQGADEPDSSIDTTGLDLWTPAVRLCVSFLQSGHGQRLTASHSSLRVLELGAGLGAAGLLAAQCMGTRASGLCLTDGSEYVLSLLRHNASLNPLQNGACICTKQLRFGHDDDAAAVLAESGDPLLVIACEVLFSRALALPLLRTLRQLLCQTSRRRNGIALLSHTVRRSIFAGPGGRLMQESTDTVLDTFLQAAANPVVVDGGDHGDGWSTSKLEVRLLASTHESGAAATIATHVSRQPEQESLEDKKEQEMEEEVRLYAIVASQHHDDTAA